MKPDKIQFLVIMAVGIALIVVLESTLDLGRYDGKVAYAIIMGGFGR